MAAKATVPILRDYATGLDVTGNRNAFGGMGTAEVFAGRHCGALTQRNPDWYKGPLGSQPPIGRNSTGLASNDTFPAALHVAAPHAKDGLMLPKDGGGSIENKAPDRMGVAMLGERSAGA
jgi:hypothetical protein